MGYLQPGYAFTDTSPGNAVNAALLAQLVSNAVILPAFYSSQTDGSTAIAPGDTLVFLQASSGQFRSVSVSALAGSLVFVSPSAPPTQYQDTAHAWIQTNASSNFNRSGLRLWDNGSNQWRRVYSVPLGTVVGSVVTGSYDSTGLGTGPFDGWAQCNGNNGTVNLNATTAPTVTSAAGATVVVSTSFSYTITGSNSPTAFAASGLPSGLSVNASTGVISGTPTATGTSTVVLTVYNASGSGTATLTLTVVASSSAVPVITSAAGATYTNGAAVSYQIAATNTPTSFAASGLPSGLSVSAGGLITGTPAASGTFTIGISATNGTGTGNATLTLLVSAQTYIEFIGYNS